MPSPAYDLRELPVVPSKHPGRWISGILVLAVVALICYVVFSSKSIQWSAIPQYLANSSILSGLTVTIWLTFASMAIGIAGGILLAVMRMSTNLVLKTVSGVYIWLFRGTPLLVQIIFWFNIALFVPRVHLLGINISTNSLISPYTAALLALGLNEAAYMSEIVRGGLLSVDPGQHEAALATGLTPRQTLRKVVLPQAMRAIVPPTSNQIIGMLKTTSLVSVVAAQELLTKAEAIYATNFLTIELLMAASIWYLVLTTVGSVIQYFVERHYARGTTSARVETVWQRIARNLVPGRGRLLSANRSGS